LKPSFHEAKIVRWHGDFEEQFRGLLRKMYPKNMDEPKTVDVGDLLKGVKEGEGGEVAGFKLAT